MADEVITLVETTETIVVEQKEQQIVEVIQPPTPQILEVVQQGAQGPKGDQGPNSIGGYGFGINNLQTGDVLMFGVNLWVNTPKSDIADGGNF